MIPSADLLVIVGIAGGSSLAVAVAGSLLLRAVRRRSLRLSLVLVAIVPVTGVLVGAVAAGAVMFFSEHDLRVLLLVAGTAGSVAVATALVLARRVAGGSRALGVASAGLSDGSYRSPDVPLTAELAELDRQLAETSVRLEGSRQRARALEGSRRELVAWVSHDLRTPLAGIRAMAEALEDAVVDDPDTIDRYHGQIRREADRLSTMVSDLFELSRIHASVLDLDVRDVSLADVLSDAVATAMPVAAVQGVTVSGERPEGPALVRGSVPELGRVMSNLLSNAVRHTPPGGEVRIWSHLEGGQVVVRVVDGCGGIPDEDLPRLFEVAFRGGAARTPDRGSGAGLGLAIARGLVEAHGGTVDIRNHGPGCCATVRLPAVPVPTPTVADALTDAR